MKKLIQRALCSAALTVIGLWGLLPAQSRTDSQGMSLQVSVHDKDGRPVNDLTQTDFQLFEDKVHRPIAFFKHDDAPTSLGLIIDASGSMRTKRERVSEAVLSFIRGGNPENETFIAGFGDAAEIKQGFTRSIANLIDALDRFTSRGQTALYDAIHLSLTKAVTEGRNERRVLLLISDGDDNASKRGYDETLKELKESSVMLYVIGLTDENERRSRAGSKARQVLQEFADATGGVAYFPKSINEVEGFCKDIAHDLRNLYTIGFKPSDTAMNGDWHDIRVAITPSRTASRFTARTRRGYFARPVQRYF